jgi:hypothetical protein
MHALFKNPKEIVGLTVVNRFVMGLHMGFLMT